MTAAIFRAEFLRALPLIPWLLSLHGLMLGLRTRWSGELSPLLSGVIEWGTWALALVILIGSAWHDSPSRRECFLGTRPMKVISLIAAKFAALSILITLPFVVVEYAALLWADQPLRVAEWGALQTGLFATACVLATLTVTWVWSSRAEAFTGLGIALVGGAVAMALFLRRPGYLFAWIPISRISMPSATTTLTGLIVLTLLGAIVAIALRRRAAAIKVPAFLIASCLSLVVAREASFPHPHGARETHSALVHLTLSTRELGDRLANWLEIEPPGPALNANQDVVWNFSKLSVNGHRVPLWSNQGIDGHLRPNNPDMVKTEPIRQALFSHYGSRLQIPEPQGTTSYPATIDLPGNHDPARMLDLDIVLTGTILEWRVVADLPANGKATSRYGDTRWTIESAPQPGQRGFRRMCVKRYRISGCAVTRQPADFPLSMPTGIS